MAQPEYVPLSSADRVRPAERLPPARTWRADRPADLQRPDRPAGRGFGSPGPDQGYGLKLARMFEDRLQLAAGEQSEDVVAGCLGVGLKRASIFGRAPVIYDLELAFTLWGFLDAAPVELVEMRRPLFQGAAHHYWDKREIVDRIPERTLRMTPAEVRDRLSDDWRSLFSM